MRTGHALSNRNVSAPARRAFASARGGKGDGPLAAELRTAPADLTRLSESNRGKFCTGGHGTRTMTIVGRQFLAGDKEIYGPLGGEASTQGRIQNWRNTSRRCSGGARLQPLRSVRVDEPGRKNAEKYVIADDQRPTVAFLSDPASTATMGRIDVIETHISRIFLGGDRAWKTKRAVKLPYVDFSTPELRLAACRREVDLNSLTAPGLYIAAHRITRQADGSVALDGDGKLLDAVVEMHRFDQNRLLDHMATAGELTPSLLGETAQEIERFHRAALVSRSESGSANMAAVLDINEAGFAECRIFKAEELEKFNEAMRQRLAEHAPLLDRRAAGGRVRRCHGDLHLRNICLLDGSPQLFDCIEFNDRIATVDVLYDFAFLLMDLWHRGLNDLANLTMNRYLDRADDEDGFALLPFFMAVRAAVRAHVLGTQLAEGDRDPGTVDEARSYFRLASALLEKMPPRLIAIGGLSGSGKTTVAEAAAAHVGAPPGARIVESDRIRKAMHSVPPETRLPQKAYRPEVSENVYREMAWRSGLILAQGGSVVADAVFDRTGHRAMIEKSATEHGVPFHGVWLTASEEILWQRVTARRGGPSDATVDILAKQLDRDIGPVEWTRLDASGPLPEIVAAILDMHGSQAETISPDGRSGAFQRANEGPAKRA